jgi:hypothetical protein
MMIYISPMILQNARQVLYPAVDSYSQTSNYRQGAGEEWISNAYNAIWLFPPDQCQPWNACKKPFHDDNMLPVAAA